MEDLFFSTFSSIRLSKFFRAYFLLFFLSISKLTKIYFLESGDIKCLLISILLLNSNTILTPSPLTELLKDFTRIGFGFCNLFLNFAFLTSITSLNGSFKVNIL